MKEKNKQTCGETPNWLTYKLESPEKEEKKKREQNIIWRNNDQIYPKFYEKSKLTDVRSSMNIQKQDTYHKHHTKNLIIEPYKLLILRKTLTVDRGEKTHYK